MTPLAKLGCKITGNEGTTSVLEKGGDLTLDADQRVEIVRLVVSSFNSQEEGGASLPGATHERPTQSEVKPLQSRKVLFRPGP